MNSCPCCLVGIPDFAEGGSFCPWCGVHKENFSNRLPEETWSPEYRKTDSTSWDDPNSNPVEDIKNLVRLRRGLKNHE